MLNRPAANAGVSTLFISVIIPVRNESRFIEQTLTELVDQDYAPDRFEILVVDGQSTDGTPDLVARFAAGRPNVRLFDNPRRLSSAARNIAIRHAGHRVPAADHVVLLIDGHCGLADRRYLQKLAAAFERSGADCLGRPQPQDYFSPLPPGEGPGVRPSAFSPLPPGEGQGVRAIANLPPGEGQGVRATAFSPLPPGEGPGVRTIAVSPLPPGEGPGVRATAFSPLPPGEGPGLRAIANLPPGEAPGVRAIAFSPLPPGEGQGVRAVPNLTTLQRAIAAARSSRLGHHPDSFIYSSDEQFVPAESVAVAYRRSVFEKVGYFDENFDACEDVEFNHRVDRAGLRCFFTPAIAAHYAPRDTLRGLYRQMVRYGRGRIRLWRKHPETFSWGIVPPLLFVIGLIAGLPLCFAGYPLVGGWLAAALCWRPGDLRRDRAGRFRHDRPAWGLSRSLQKRDCPLPAWGLSRFQERDCPLPAWGLSRLQKRYCPLRPAGLAAAGLCHDPRRFGCGHDFGTVAAKIGFREEQPENQGRHRRGRRHQRVPHHVKNLRALLVFGTRPEAIKMAPIVEECRRRADDLDTIVCLTGQHREMLAQVTEYFGIDADEQLDLMRPNQTLAGLTARCIEGIDEVLSRRQPHCVVAQGDTTTVMAASLAAFYRHIPFVHVEAGLRTGNLQAPYPEEMNRRVADIATSLYCADKACRRYAAV